MGNHSQARWSVVWGGGVGRGLQAPAMENHWPWPAGPGKTPFGPSGCLGLYTSLRVFINTLFRVEKLPSAQENKHVGNHGDLSISHWAETA